MIFAGNLCVSSGMHNFQPSIFYWVKYQPLYIYYVHNYVVLCIINSVYIVITYSGAMVEAKPQADLEAQTEIKCFSTALNRLITH